MALSTLTPSGELNRFTQAAIFNPNRSNMVTLPTFSASWPRAALMVMLVSFLL